MNNCASQSFREITWNLYEEKFSRLSKEIGLPVQFLLERLHLCDLYLGSAESLFLQLLLKSKDREKGRRWESRELSRGVQCLFNIFCLKMPNQGQLKRFYHSLSPCLFHKWQNNLQDGTFLELECHVGNHIHTPFRLDAILDWATRMRFSLDLERCGRQPGRCFDLCGISWTKFKFKTFTNVTNVQFFTKNFIYKFQSQFDSVFGLVQRQSFTVQGQIQKIQKEMARTHNGSILDTVYFSATEFYENNTTFQRKKGGCSPLGSPLKSTHAVMAKCSCNFDW